MSIYKIVCICLSFSWQFIMGSHSEIMSTPTPVEENSFDDNPVTNSKNYDIRNSFAYTWKHTEKNALSNTYKDNVLKLTYLTFDSNKNECSKWVVSDPITIDNPENDQSAITQETVYSSAISYCNVYLKFSLQPTKVYFKKCSENNSLTVDFYLDQQHIASFLAGNSSFIEKIMDVKREKDFTTIDYNNNYMQNIGPANLFDKVSTVTYHNGWYPEKIGTYDKNNKFTIRSTWQHKLYIFSINSPFLILFYIVYVLYKKRRSC